ncbi:MAG: pitrilysin family protein [Bacteroidota bacterium]|nr:pitrilysin family protein [Bacteroidota bacterium]
MIHFERHTLANGLRVLVNEDTTTPLAAVNIMYDVGARDEDPARTGFAHLFEHLMFGGSVNIPKFDEPLGKIGGHNNAFTNNDVTTYYCTLPVQNIETAFWLESDRMLDLAFSQKSLDVQRNVVSEEFRQVYLNQPYGDTWLLLRPLAYKVHPYQWPTIGKSIEHVQEANMEDVRSFYKKHYNPNNAVLVVSGNLKPGRVFKLAEKWFGSIENQGKNRRNLPQEPVQTAARFMEVEREVPLDAIYKAYHMCPRLEEPYYATDLISDILSNGNSSRLFQKLVKEKKLFSDISAYITGDIDAGMFVINGNLINGASMQEAEEAIDVEIRKIKSEKVKTDELQKVKNKVESGLIFAEANTLNKVINLSHMEIIRDAALNNQLIDRYNAVSVDDIRETALKVLDENNCSTLHYFAKKDA